MREKDQHLKMIKENWHLRAYFILHSFNNALSSSEYPAGLKYADITQNRHLIAYFILYNLYNALLSSEYPASLKYAYITPIFKKDDKTDKINNIPISILPNLMKMYERFMQNHVSISKPDILKLSVWIQEGI